MLQVFFSLLTFSTVSTIADERRDIYKSRHKFFKFVNKLITSISLSNFLIHFVNYSQLKILNGILKFFVKFKPETNIVDEKIKIKPKSIIKLTTQSFQFQLTYHLKNNKNITSFSH